MLRILLADDEPPARKRLTKLLKPLQEAGRVKIVGEAQDGVETLEKLEQLDVDLLLLDIRMPELDGFDVLERIPEENRPQVVFITAYDEYALRAFQANAIDYLLKPIDKERLQEAIAKAEKSKASNESRSIDNERLGKLLDWFETQTEGSPLNGDSSSYMKLVSIPYRDRILVVPVHRLLSAEISEGITRLCILNEDTEGHKGRIRQHIVSYTLEQLEEHLDPNAFLRVHRSAIVQLDHIQELIPWFSGRYKLILTGQHEVIASRERSKLLKERLMVDLKK